MENFEIPVSELKNIGTLKEFFQHQKDYALDEPEYAHLVALEVHFIKQLIASHNDDPFDEKTHFPEPNKILFIHSEDLPSEETSPTIHNAMDFFSEDSNNIYNRLDTKKINPDARLIIPYLYNDYYYISINDKPAIYITGEDHSGSSVFSYQILIVAI